MNKITVVQSKTSQDLFTFEEAAKETGVRAADIYQKRRNRSIPAVKGKNKDGRQVWMIARKDLCLLSENANNYYQNFAVIYISSTSEYTNNTVKRAKSYCMKNRWLYRIYNQESLATETYAKQVLTKVTEDIISHLKQQPENTKLVLVGAENCQRRKFLINEAQKYDIEIHDLASY